MIVEIDSEESNFEGICATYKVVHYKQENYCKIHEGNTIKINLQMDIS